MQDTRRLRRDLRTQRRALSESLQREHASAVARIVTGWLPYLRARRIAVYFESDGELGMSPLIDDARRRGKTIYLPVLHPFAGGRLWFIRWRESDPLHLNRYRIPEPPVSSCSRALPQMLDMVFVPLVGFDDRCNRLGMGGGYYDRTFGYRGQRDWRRHPLLVGVAHELQHVRSIETNAWDVSLDRVITERRVCSCHMKQPA